MVATPPPAQCAYRNGLRACALFCAPGSTYCFFHDAAYSQALAATVAARVRAAMLLGDCDFIDVAFRDVLFIPGVVPHAVLFDNCEFQECHFLNVEFAAPVTFRSCRSTDGFKFDNVTFYKTAEFRHHRHSRSAAASSIRFRKVSFGGQVDFIDTQWNAAVSIEECTYAEAAFFSMNRWDSGGDSITVRNLDFGASARFGDNHLAGASVLFEALTCKDTIDFTRSQFGAVRTTVAKIHADVVSFEGAWFRPSSLTLRDITARESLSLDGADMIGSVIHTSLDRASLTETNLDRADLRKTSGAAFDRTRLVGAALPEHPDLWLELRRAYSGPMFALHLILLALFLLPFFLRAAELTLASRAQTQTRIAAAQLDKDADAAPSPATTALLRTSATTLRRLDVCGEAGRSCTRQSIAAVLVGWGQQPHGLGWMSWWPWVLLMLVYNTIRGWLTLETSLLRDESDRTGAWPPLAKYRRLKGWHQFMRVFMIFAVLSFVIRMVDWLFLTTLDVPM